MFGFLKEKLKSWFGKSKEKVEKEAEKAELSEEKKVEKKPVKAEAKPEKKIEQKKPGKPVKEEKRKEEIKKEKKAEKKEDKKREDEKKEKKPEKPFQAEAEILKIEKKLEEEEKEEFKTLEELPKKEEIPEEREVSEEIAEDIKKEGEERPEILKEEVEEIEEIKEEAEEKTEEREKKKGFFSRIFSRKYIITEQEFSGMFEELEMIMLENNVALEVVDYLRGSLGRELVNKEVDKDKVEDEIKSALKNSLEGLFVPSFKIEERIKSKQPFVIAFFGINGSGKTTSIAKLAYKLKQKGFSCVLAAADTFRAASIEQLKQHGDKLGVKVIHQTYGSDPASVAYDAIEYAKSHKIDAVLIDTAGRMHTKDNLIKEMGKIVRVAKPDLKIFVGEALTGNDATEQAKTFNEAINIDGIILSKQDVDEKGGTSLSVSYITKKPILFLGMGQEYKDLEVFDKDKLLRQLDL
jgi:fused signal recognition particle receptor